MRIMALTTPNGIIIGGNVGSDNLSELITQNISEINATNYRLIDPESDIEKWQFPFAGKCYGMIVKSSTKRSKVIVKGVYSFVPSNTNTS